jgi:hypothetical protein
VRGQMLRTYGLLGLWWPRSGSLVLVVGPATSSLGGLRRRLIRPQQKR